MNFADFTPLALRTESGAPDVVSIDPDVFDSIVTLASSTGEILNELKRNIFYKAPVRDENLKTAITQANSALGRVAYFLDPASQAGGSNAIPIDINARFFHAVLGKTTESIELIEAVTKGSMLDLVNLIEEIGDDQWYDAILADELAVLGHADAFGTARTKVIAKLQHRYPDKFTTEAAVNRDLAGEYQVLAK